MATKTYLPIPVVKALRKLGQDISYARRRRRITAKLLSERAGINPRTLSNIEQGKASVSIGSYVSVLFALGMVDRLSDLVDAHHDEMGLGLETERLPQRVRMPRRTK